MPAQLSFQTGSVLPPAFQAQYAGLRTCGARNGLSCVGCQVQPDCTWVPPTDVTYGETLG